MKSHRRFHLQALIGTVILGLLIIGCSSESPFQPSDSNQSAFATTNDVDNDIYPPDDDPDLGPPSIRTTTTGLRETGDGEISIQSNKVADVAFEGIVLDVDLVDSSLTFFTFTGQQWVGLVNSSSELVDSAGNAVPMADFQICMMADVEGVEIATDTLELVHVLYRPF